MSALLELPLPSVVQDETLTFAAVASERAALEHLARTGTGADVRAEALVGLMALEAAVGDELSFERLRHELLGRELSPSVATLYRVQVAWGLVRFGRVGAARRWVRRSDGR
jgi:voltage-gated potassium channel Kch